MAFHPFLYFEGLSEGGDVISPGAEMFWTPFFGAVTDRFGIPWQISVEVAQDDGSEPS